MTFAVQQHENALGTHSPLKSLTFLHPLPSDFDVHGCCEKQCWLPNLSISIYTALVLLEAAAGKCCSARERILKSSTNHNFAKLVALLLSCSGWLRQYLGQG